MAHRINQMFLGLLCIFLDLNLGIIDLLPDVLGYILLSMAFDALQKQFPKATNGMAITWVTLGLHVGNLVIATREEWYILSSLMGLLFQLALLGMIYFICEVVYEVLGKISVGEILKPTQNFEAVSYNLTSSVLISNEQTKKACESQQLDMKSIWNAYMFTNLVGIALSTFAINQVEVINGLMALVGIINLIVMVRLLFKLREIRNNLKEYN